MGTSYSCLPVTFNTSPSRHSKSKIKYDIQETFPNNKNPINLNKVSEDELLFLPGITRELAINIIQYRHINNGFKQIDEILQVKGITLNLFKRIYNDITIDLSNSLNNKQDIVNINLASYNELCLVPGLTPNLVKRIIHRRQRKGLFRFMEDLLKIKGIDYIILATIHPHVTIHQQRDHSRASLLLKTLPPELHQMLISSPLSRPSNILDYKQKNFRFASWNLQELTNDKIQNPGVREIICQIILENKFSLIGIQDIRNKESLDLIIQELNNPTIPLIKNWPNRHQGKWKYTISNIPDEISQECEYLGFLYDESIGIELKQSSLLSVKKYFTQLPFITIFRVYEKFELVFVNIHLKSNKDEARALGVLAEAMKNTIEQKYVIIFGDFNIIPTASEFQPLIKCNYSYVIQENTDIHLKNPQGSTCVDNIWLSEQAKLLSTGNSGVIRTNLHSMWIPADWTWGGLVSDHCPIWIEFDLSEIKKTV